MNPTIGDEIELGSLAIELGILSEQELLSAIGLWLEEKSQSLTDILERDCGVDADELELARALQSARRKSRSTASAGDDESQPTGSMELRRLTSSDELSPSEINRFERGKLFAQGGLGVLYEGHDRELNRTVAIKELNESRLVDPWSLERFKRESAITAALEHPYIVPIHGRGVRPDGTPFYAMRMIQGITLREAADTYHAQPSGDATSNRLTFRKLLSHLIPVGQAIAYAHSKNIIHRDLKPSNVILGKHGETMLIDWGLARKVGETEVEPHREAFDQNAEFELTAEGTAIGTLAYMSPEQARGDNRADQSTDIYGLGGILFYVLTGAPPRVSQSPNDMIRLARDGTFSEEKLLHASVPRPLAAICRRAMSVDPKDRYATADQFVNELESYLADEPVAALPDSFMQTVGRWIRTHQATAAAGLATLLISSVAMGISLGILSSKNESLRQANQREHASRLKANESAEIAQENGQEALRQRQRVLGILKSFLVDVERGLANVPGSAAVQRNVLNTVLQKLGEVSSEFAGDGEFRQSNIMALMDLGDLFSRVGTKGITLDLPNQDLSALTPLEAADAVYTEAMKMAEQSMSANANEARRTIATIQQKRGDILSQSARTSEAVELFEKSLATRRILLAELPQSVDLMLEVTSSIDSLGKIYLQNNDTNRAQQAYEETVSLLSSLAPGDANNTDVKRSLCIARSRLGDIAIRNGELEKAVAYYEADLAVTKELYEQRPDDLVTKRDLCISLDRIGNIAVHKGQLPQAIELFQQSRKYREELRSADPTSIRAIHELFISNMKCGDTRMLNNDIAGAQSDYTQSSTLADEMASLDPSNSNAKRFQSLAAEVLSDIFIQQNQLESALEYSRKSFAISQELAAKDPTDSDKQRDLSLGHIKVSKVLTRLNRHAESLDQLASALRIVQSAFDQNPGLLLSVNDLSMVHLSIAEVQLGSKAFAEAKENCESAVRLIESVPDANRQDSITRRRFVNALMMLGQSQILLGEVAGARSNLQRALQLAETMIKEGVRAEQMQMDAKEIENLLQGISRPNGENAESPQ